MPAHTSAQFNIITGDQIPDITARQTDVAYFINVNDDHLRLTFAGDRDLLDDMLHRMLKALDDAAATIPNHPSLEGFTPKTDVVSGDFSDYGPGRTLIDVGTASDPTLPPQSPTERATVVYLGDPSDIGPAA